MKRLKNFKLKKGALDAAVNLDDVSLMADILNQINCSV
jgi:hypothetical protein